MFCGKCGNEVKDGEKFCGKCGTPVLNYVNHTTVPNTQIGNNIIIQQLHPPGFGKAVGSIILGLTSLIAFIFALWTLFNPDKLYPDNPYYNDVNAQTTFTKMIIAVIVSVICSIIGIVLSVGAKKMGYTGSMHTAGRVFSIISLVAVILVTCYIIFAISSIINTANQAASFYG
ncbi:MAG: zinc-ribbon domain-containing protein [Acutalibacteraceae bacterium]